MTSFVVDGFAYVPVELRLTPALIDRLEETAVSMNMTGVEYIEYIIEKELRVSNKIEKV